MRNIGGMNMDKNKMPIQRCIAGEEISCFSDVELLAVLIGTGSKDCMVMELAQKLLKDYGSPVRLYAAGLRELADEYGIGPAKAVKIKCAIEFGKRIINDKNEFLEIWL